MALLYGNKLAKELHLKDGKTKSGLFVNSIYQDNFTITAPNLDPGTATSIKVSKHISKGWMMINPFTVNIAVHARLRNTFQ